MRLACPELCLQSRQGNLFLIGAHPGGWQILDEFQLISTGDSLVTHLIHDRFHQMRSPPTQGDFIQRLATDPRRVRRFTVVQQRELQSIVNDSAVQLHFLVMVALVGMSNDVGQGLVNGQNDSLARLLRQAENDTHLAYRGADDAQEAWMAWHNKFQMKAHFGSVKTITPVKELWSAPALFDCNQRLRIALARCRR